MGLRNTPKQPEDSAWTAAQAIEYRHNRLMKLTEQHTSAHGDRGEQYRIRRLQDEVLDDIERIRVADLRRRLKIQ